MVIQFDDSDRSFSLNVAATCVGTTTLGPGTRSVVWVQGCPFTCPGCIAPEWIPRQPARLVDPDALAAHLLAPDAITGLTFSGGEPMLQAVGLARLIRVARRTREVNLICFTGFRLDELRRRPVDSGVPALLDEIDVLIDGRYEQARDDGRGLRGSTNQQVHHLTDRLAGTGYDFTGRARSAEIRLTGPEALLVGIPPPGLAAVFDRLPTTLRNRSGTPSRHPGPASRAGGRREPSSTTPAPTNQDRNEWT